MIEPLLPPRERHLVAEARTATLATIRSDGRPRLVPVCFVLSASEDASGRPTLYTALDEKAKRSPDPHRLGRVSDLVRRPEATMLVEHWDEDWTRLAWVRLDGRGELLEPHPSVLAEHRAAVDALRSKYPQYRGHGLEERPIIRIVVERVQSWRAADAP
jgi:PPOX class probable F420-dependent enzyme